MFKSNIHFIFLYAHSVHAKIDHWHFKLSLTKGDADFFFLFRKASQITSRRGWSNSLLIERSCDAPYRTERRLLGPCVVRSFPPSTRCLMQCLAASTTATHCDIPTKLRIPPRLWPVAWINDATPVKHWYHSITDCTQVTTSHRTPPPPSPRLKNNSFPEHLSHIMNLVIVVTRPPVIDCGTIFHPDYGGRDCPSIPSDML